jgi:hypothetical protein
MRLAFKMIGYLVLSVAVLLGFVLLTLRYQPDWVVALANKVQSDAVIEASGVGVTFLPLNLSFSRVEVVMSGQSIRLFDGAAGLDYGAWRKDRPFWMIDIDSVQIEQDTQPLPAAESSPIGQVNFLPYLTFSNIRVGELTMTGGSPLVAHFSATQAGSDINITADGRIADKPFELTAALTRTSTGLRFLVEAASEERQNSGQLEEAATSISLNLHGLLNFGNELSLVLDDGWLKSESEEVTHILGDLAGGVTLLSNATTQRLVFDDLIGTYMAPGFQDSLPVSLSGTIEDFSAEPSFDVVAEVGQSVLKLTGVATGAYTQVAASAQLTSDGVDSSLALAPYTSADVFPLKVATDFLYTQDILTLSDLNFESPANAFTGNVEIGLTQVLKLTADLTAERLYVPLIETSASTETAVEVEVEVEVEAVAEEATTELTDVASASGVDSEETMFSQEAIDSGWLTTAEIEVVLAASELKLQEAVFENLRLKLISLAGRLTLDPFTATLGAGGFEARASLSLGSAPDVRTTSAKLPELVQSLDAALQLKLNGVALESFGFVPQEELQGGALEVDVDLVASGSSAHDFASSLTGELLIMVEDAVLMNDFVELAGSDLIMETLNKLNPFAKKDPTTQLQCGLVRFSADNGQLFTDKQLIMETSKMEIVGDGKIDLATERLNITMTPNAKSGIGVNVGSLVKFLKLGGTLTNPRPAADAGGLLKSGLAIGAAISTGGVSILAEGIAKRALNAGSACAAIRKERATAETASTGT